MLQVRIMKRMNEGKTEESRFLGRQLIISAAAYAGIIILYYINHMIGSAGLFVLSGFLFLSFYQYYDFFLNIYGLFGFVWNFTLGLSALQLHANQTDWKLETWVLFSMAYLCFLTGAEAEAVFTLKHGRSDPDPQKQIPDRKRFFCLIAVAFVLSSGALVFTTLVRGGLPLFSEYMSAYHDFGISGIQYLVKGSSLLIPLILIYHHYYGKFSSEEIVLFSISSLYSLLVPLLTVSRQLAFSLLVFSGSTYLILAFSGNHPRGKKKHLMIELLTAAIVLSGSAAGWVVIGNYRNQSQDYLNSVLNIDEMPRLQQKAMVAYMYVACDYDNFNLNVGEITQHTYGEKVFFPLFALSGLKFVIPSVNHDPAEELYLITPTYTTFSLLMEPYQDFGFVGVLIYLFAIGYFCSACERKRRMNPSTLILRTLIRYCLIFSFFYNGFSSVDIWFYMISLMIAERLILKIPNKSAEIAEEKMSKG